MNKRYISWAECQRAADDLADVIRKSGRYLSIFGVPRGGVPVAVLLSQRLDLPLVEDPVGPGVLVVDDIVDSGATRERFSGPFAALFARSRWNGEVTAARHDDDWLVFPWELYGADAAGPADAVIRLLEHVGEDPTREGLIDTPARVLRSLSEMTSGYDLDPADILARRFTEACDEMVVVDGIEFVSLCEHHMLPFVGQAVVGYLPDRHVVGLSKIPRLVECFARRLQVQERLTNQIAEALMTHVEPLGVGVVLRAHHSCMSCRGVRKATAQMVTSSMLGALRDKPEARAEFLALASVVGR